MYEVTGTILWRNSPCDYYTGALLYCKSCGSKAVVNSFGSVDNQGNYLIAQKQPHFGTTHISPKVKCPACGQKPNPQIDIEHFTTPVIEVELGDPEKGDTTTDRLKSVFFGNDDTRDVVAGETVTIQGYIHIIRDDKSRNSRHVMYAKRVTYHSRGKNELTEEDMHQAQEGANAQIEECRKLKSECKLPKDIPDTALIIPKLVEMSATNIIGNEHVKEGLLYVEACAMLEKDDFIFKGIGERERLHAILVGLPGLAKTKLARAFMRRVPRSEFVSAKASTGRTLTISVKSDHDNSTSLDVGPFVTAAGAIVVVDEVGRMSFEDQAHMLDAPEEGILSAHKASLHASVRADCSVIATANPRSSKFKAGEDGSDLVEHDDIPALRELIDRFDLIHIFKNDRSDQEIDELVDKKSQMRQNPPKNYDEQVSIYLRYVKAMVPEVEVSPEAAAMLDQAFKKLLKQGWGPRSGNTLYRLIKARARLQFKNIADTYDAQQTISFYNTMLLPFIKVLLTAVNPVDKALEVMLESLHNSKFPLSVEQLAEETVQKSPQVASYLGKDGPYRTRDNMKLRRIIEGLDSTNMWCRLGTIRLHSNGSTRRRTRSKNKKIILKKR